MRILQIRLLHPIFSVVTPIIEHLGHEVPQSPRSAESSIQTRQNVLACVAEVLLHISGGLEQ